MALSPAHRFGQMIGDLLESAIAPLLKEFAENHGLYLDQKEPRSCRSGRKCTWVDRYEIPHDLDFVLERGGDHSRVGVPVAFIETAWRRHTKHSRNKAQEIQGAILPIAEKHTHSKPFKGVILAGVFTPGALDQLRENEFAIVYISYDNVVAAFHKLRINAAYDEDTSHEDLRAKIIAFEELTNKQRDRLKQEILKQHRSEITDFLELLSMTVTRRIVQVIVIALHGRRHESADVFQAIDYIKSYDDKSAEEPVDRYEIQARYNNGDSIVGTFHCKDDAIQFLNGQESHVHKRK